MLCSCTLYVLFYTFFFIEKKRRKNTPLTPPPLLLQDPETAHKRIQNRMAMLLTEEVEFPSTPPLPASRILEEEPRKAAWLLSLPKDQRCILWEYSTLTGPCVPESFYAVGLTPPILPWKPVQVRNPSVLSSTTYSHQWLVPSTFFLSHLQLRSFALGPCRPPESAHSLALRVYLSSFHHCPLVV